MKHRCLASGLALTLVLGFTSTQSSIAAAGQARASGDTSVPAGEMNLGSVTIPRSVTADGKPLKSGTYRLRLTADNATPVPPGQTAQYERWVEFLTGGKVVGREVVSIVPASEIKDVAQDAPPASGGSKVQLLKGNDYIRVWLNRGGTHYLMHLPTGATPSE